ncbi:2-oxoglutarate-dependent dioxygenase phqC [Exophiala dermatitidis]
MEFISGLNACASNPVFPQLSSSIMPHLPEAASLAMKMPSPAFHTKPPTPSLPPPTRPNGSLVDFSKYTSPDPLERAECRRQLLRCLTDDGFARVINCGIPNDMVDEIFRRSEEFFRLDPKSKLAIANPRGPTPQRGYSHVGAENSSSLYGKLVGDTSNAHRSDAREHFDQGSEADADFPNRWPAEAELPGFRQFMQDYYKASEQVCMQLFKALEEALNLQPGTFCSQVRDASELRLLHYPKISLQEIRSGKVSRIWPHFDLGLLTMLWARGATGLEFERRRRNGSDDAFVPVSPQSPCELILSTCETFQRWTNDTIPAALHQVTIPRHLRDAEEGFLDERYSVAFFCKADRNALVGSLEPFVDPVEGPRYPPVTALEYHQNRLKDAY